MLTRLRELLAAATPGEWRLYAVKDTIEVQHGEPRPINGRAPVVHWMGFDGADMTVKQKRTNATLIVAAHNALPALLDAIDAAKAMRLSISQTIPGTRFECQAFDAAIRRVDESTKEK